ncbi:hypothetical protein C2E16_12795 [Mixta calida]|uniref:Uncharacterized protein n=1 Tax=Mixta calida TaxID=665913 RepID=A0ABN5HCZ4_9GAMM|nr:hypothetical protein C2E16_12795 [Mixta calida]POU39790.1 hypothetical protein C3380_23935 [Pantoea sp. PSNIH5]POU58368.1 hypothetical protein C3374_24040 [Pantoea sp. PSNIH4]POY65368.1 hypothetical protein C3402_23825 [Pantoea sp. PSNIH3]
MLSLINLRRAILPERLIAHNAFNTAVTVNSLPLIIRSSEGCTRSHFIRLHLGNNRETMRIFRLLQTWRETCSKFRAAL